jgi:hypothetical protein
VKTNKSSKGVEGNPTSAVNHSILAQKLSINVGLEGSTEVSEGKSIALSSRLLDSPKPGLS